MPRLTTSSYALDPDAVKALGKIQRMLKKRGEKHSKSAAVRAGLVHFSNSIQP